MAGGKCKDRDGAAVLRGRVPRGVAHEVVVDQEGVPRRTLNLRGPAINRMIKQVTRAGAGAHPEIVTVGSVIEKETNVIDTGVGRGRGGTDESAIDGTIGATGSLIASASVIESAIDGVSETAGSAIGNETAVLAEAAGVGGVDKTYGKYICRFILGLGACTKVYNAPYTRIYTRADDASIQI